MSEDEDDDGVGVAVADALELAACVLCAAVVDLAEVVELDAPSSLLGHSDLMPMPFWKTPMMLDWSTRTPLHDLCTCCVIPSSPRMHAALQTTFTPKSVAWQPLMRVLYVASHCVLPMSLMRGVKLERETVADVPEMRSATPNAMVRSEVCMAVCKKTLLSLDDG